MGTKDPSLSANVVVADADAWKQDIAENLVRLPNGANANGTQTMRFKLRGVDPTAAAWTFEPVLQPVRRAVRDVRDAGRSRTRRRPRT